MQVHVTSHLGVILFINQYKTLIHKTKPIRATLRDIFSLKMEMALVFQCFQGEKIYSIRHQLSLLLIIIVNFKIIPNMNNVHLRKKVK